MLIVAGNIKLRDYFYESLMEIDFCQLMADANEANYELSLGGNGVT